MLSAECHILHAECHMLYAECHMLQTDIKGSIPRTVCNAFAARAPLAWFVRFEKECHKEAAGHLLAQGKPATPHNIKKSPPLKSLTPSASPLLSAWSTRPARRSDPGQSPFRLSGPVEPRSNSFSLPSPSFQSYCLHSHSHTHTLTITCTCCYD